jgi:hypothetical protein
MWGAFASQGTTIYLTKFTQQEQYESIPVPEKSSPATTAQIIEVMSLEVAAGTSPRLVGIRRHIREPFTSPGAYDDVELDENGKVSLLSRNEIGTRLREAGSLACDGAVEYDQQDSRVRYYLCAGEGVAYRFEYPYRVADRLALGPIAGAPSRLGTSFKFSSVSGDRKVFVSVGSNRLYVLDLDRPDAANELNRFAEPEAALELLGSEADKLLAPDTPRNSRLIAISSTIRAHQVWRERMEAVLIRPGQPLMRLELPEKFAARQDVEVRYLARSDMILWIAHKPGSSYHVLAWHLSSGKTSTMSFSPP